MFVGDDWAEKHHDVELQDHTGMRLAKARLDEGVDGVAKLHELVARRLIHRRNQAAVPAGPTMALVAKDANDTATNADPAPFAIESKPT